MFQKVINIIKHNKHNKNKWYLNETIVFIDLYKLNNIIIDK